MYVLLENAQSMHNSTSAVVFESCLGLEIIIPLTLSCFGIGLG